MTTPDVVYLHAKDPGERDGDCGGGEISSVPVGCEVELGDVITLVDWGVGRLVGERGGGRLTFVGGAVSTTTGAVD